MHYKLLYFSLYQAACPKKDVCYDISLHSAAFFKTVHVASASYSITKFKETIFIFAKYDAHHVVSFPAI